MRRWAHHTAGIDWSPVILVIIIFFIRQVLHAARDLILPGVK
jgi:uncharacterized protein YggT (Ycf19 family)